MIAVKLSSPDAGLTLLDQFSGEVARLMDRFTIDNITHVKVDVNIGKHVEIVLHFRPTLDEDWVFQKFDHAYSQSKDVSVRKEL